MSTGTIIIELAASGILAVWLIALVAAASWITAGAIQSRKDRRDEFADAFGDVPSIPDPFHDEQEFNR